MGDVQVPARESAPPERLPVVLLDGGPRVVHGGTVGVLVKWHGYSEFAAVWLGVTEALVHFLIDSGKCERWYGMAVDQTLHLLCKGLWCVLLVRGIVS